MCFFLHSNVQMLLHLRILLFTETSKTEIYFLPSVCPPSCFWKQQEGGKTCFLLYVMVMFYTIRMLFTFKLFTVNFL